MGTVDVERYTGSCLIATAIRPSKSASHKQQHARTESPQMGGEVASTTGGAHPVGLPGNDPRNWAGAPLLSMAASIRKSSGGGGGPAGSKAQLGHKHWHHHNHHPHVYLPALPAYPVHHHHQMSHLQGAPLIRVPRHPFQQPNKKPAQMRRPFVPPLPVPQPSCPPPVPNSVKQASVVSSSVVILPDSSSSSSGSDTCSVTSDEGLASGGSESSLPRIIKPRRRKKTAHHHQRPVSCITAIHDDLDVDPLTELFKSSISITGIDSTSNNSRDVTIPPPPPLSWPVQQEDDIWCSSSASQSSWNSLSPTWSSSSSSPSSSASCWPDAKVIRRPTPGALSSIAAGAGMGSSSQSAGPGLQVSSQLIASPFNGHRDIEIRFFSPPPSLYIPTSK